MDKVKTITVLLLAVAVLTGCAQKNEPIETRLKHFAGDTMDGVISVDGVSVDQHASQGNKGVLKLSADKSTEFHLYEMESPGVDDARLIYRAKLRSENLTGKAYLELWVRFPGTGEFFSKSLDRPLTGTTNWTSMETPFFLKSGQKPDLVRLDVFVEGSGTVWVSDVELLKAPLKQK